MSESHADLDHIRVRFATFRDHAADARAEIAAGLRSIATNERVLLDTCHRVELVSVDHEPPTDGLVAGRDAVRRVFEVVAGFDSAIVAEEQLLGQARGAYEAALADGVTGPILNELFRRALRFGRRVRTHARPGADRSLADPGLAWLLEHLPPPPARILVAGTGDMGHLAAARLAAAGYSITVVSASAERGDQLLQQVPGAGHHVSVGSIGAEDLATAAGVVMAVRTREPILTAAMLTGGARPWTMDFSAPSAVASDATRRLGARLMTVDRLGARPAGDAVFAPHAERRLRGELADEVERFVAWLDARQGADALRILHAEAEQVRRRHLDALRGRTGLDADQMAAVEAAAASMVGELLHGPSIELRRGGADAATVRRLFGLP